MPFIEDSHFQRASKSERLGAADRDKAHTKRLQFQLP